MASCELHCLTAEGHCEEIELMLSRVPGDMLEGDGDTPEDAIRRLREAYDELLENQRVETPRKEP